MYRHTQVGALILASLAAPVALRWGATQLPGAPKALLVVAAAVIAVAALLFATLTVSVGDGELRIRFGPGLVRRRWRLADIRSCEVVKNPWWYGIGIHLTPRGWLYNVAGSGAVEVGLRDGRRFRLGSDEPEELCRVLRERAGLPAATPC
jgi:hypothetical protein